MWQRLCVFWYYFRIGPLFNLMQYLGWGAVALAVIGGIALFSAIPLTLLGYEITVETVRKIFDLTLLAVIVAGLFLCFSVAQLPSVLPPEKRPKR